jgi:predicted RNase H-like HicB family nuclease
VGSHRQYKNPMKAGRVTLPGHPNDDLPPGTLNSVLKQAVESMNYVVVYEKSATGWAAYVSDLPGVVTTGPSRSEVRSLIQQAIEFHLDGLKEDRLPIPEPSAEAEIISVSQR